MNRREFMKDVAIGGLILKAGPGFLGAQPAAPDVAAITGESPAAITKAAVAALGGMKKFISRGDKVLIKPNIGWDRTPEMAACTNPDVVRTLVEMSLEAGAKEVVVMDNTTNQAKRCYVRSGIQDAAKQGGAKVLFTDDYRLKKVSLKGEWLKDWEVFQDFLEADKIINAPIAKVHSLCRLTMSMKNWLGAIGGARNQLHQKLDEAIVDLEAFFKPTLTVLDAYRILVRNGPQGGRLSDTELVKTVIAGVDAVAVDTIGASFFGVKPEELLYLKLARERGLGTFDLEKLKIEKRTI
ncbi:MAG: DUF362 domain-containing protein [Candidatus Aminicenantales bacterium]